MDTQKALQFKRQVRELFSEFFLKTFPKKLGQKEQDCVYDVLDSLDALANLTDASDQNLPSLISDAIEGAWDCLLYTSPSPRD